MKIAAALVLLAAQCLAAESSPDAPTQEFGNNADSSVLPLEARSEEGVQKLAYFGGALGHYLIIHPSGKMYITGKRRVPQGHRGDDDEDVGVADENPPTDSSDTVAINQPPENASMAEAKPVGIAIAGEGGVASSQPVGQAVVGPGGLAVSRPVATAIAGIAGAENLVLRPGKTPTRLMSGTTHGYFYSVYHHHPPPTPTLYFFPLAYL